MTRNSLPKLLAVSGATVLTVGLLAACSSSDDNSTGLNDTVQSDGSGDSGDDGEEAAPVSIATNVPAKDKQGVDIDKLVNVKASDGTITSVVLKAKGEKKSSPIKGSFSDDKATWTADARLEPNTTYTMRVVGTNDDGTKKTEKSTFSTIAVSDDQEVYPSMSPIAGSEVGVGMPILVYFDHAVTNRAAIERAMTITTDADKAIPGSWNWISDTEVHYRPKHFWPTDTKITAHLDINSVKAGPDLYGQESRTITFHTAKDRVVSTVDVNGHKMTVRINGKVARTIPVTTGMDGLETRRGWKVIMEQFYEKSMSAPGLEPGDPGYYEVPDVYYAQRVTYSGEFLHAAPWSEGSQGSANVSHGCTGMSTDEAKWLYDISHVGDPVHFINSARPLEPGNGWTDWDESWKDYKAGSALKGVNEAAQPTA